MFGYKNRYFEYASLINSGLLVFFKLIFDQEVYFRVRKFYGLVFFRVVFLGFSAVIPLLFTPKYPPGGISMIKTLSNLLASFPVNSSARLLGTFGGAVTFVLINADEQALPSALRTRLVFFMKTTIDCYSKWHQLFQMAPTSLDYLGTGLATDRSWTRLYLCIPQESNLQELLTSI